jgi:hypothetical protein
MLFLIETRYIINILTCVPFFECIQLKFQLKWGYYNDLSYDISIEWQLFGLNLQNTWHSHPFYPMSTPRGFGSLISDKKVSIIFFPFQNCNSTLHLLSKDQYLRHQTDKKLIRNVLDHVFREVGVNSFV